MLRWILRIAAGLMAIVVVVIVVRFVGWRAGIERELVKNSSIVQTSRGPIEYAEIGEGMAVLVVHGTPGGYDDPLGALKVTHAENNGFRYIVPSRPGYSRTPLSVGATPAEQADAFAALLDTLRIQKTALIAQSGGGPSALQFAMRHPERCSALVLESALVRNYSGPAPHLPKTAFGAWSRDLLIYVFAGFARFQPVDPKDPELAPLTQAALRSVVPYSLRKAGAENDLQQEAHLDGWPLDEITCPTLILPGTADQSVPVKDAEYAHAQIPGSELVDLPGQDHVMMYVKHRQLDDMISAFLRKHVSSP